MRRVHVVRCRSSVVRCEPTNCVVLLLLALLCASLPTAASEIVEREFASVSLDRPWRYTVYVPDGYARSRLRYPVLYLLHGNGQDRNTWVKRGRIQATADALIAAKEIPPTLIVMPDAGTSWFVDRKEQMESAFIRDLIPEVDKQFRTIAERQGRLLAGLSMGGYGSLRFALRYPEMFAAAGLLSPAIYTPAPPENSSARRVGVFGAPQFDAAQWKQLNYPALWSAYRAKNQIVPMFINSGDDDEYLIEAEAAELYSLLRAHGHPAELRIVDGAHTWEVWADTIDEAMRYVYRYAARPH